MNINPSDGNNFGWGGWPMDNGAVGNLASKLTNDFADDTVWGKPANYIAIMRHDGAGTCDAARVWRLASSDLSMRDIFKTGSSYQRKLITTGGVLQDVQLTEVANDPFFGVGNDIAANWWYSNNGARLVMDNPQAGGGEALSCETCNTDDVHGFGNEFGGKTQEGGYAVSGGSPFGGWWHDASVIQKDCHGPSCTIQGSDHGDGLSDGMKLGNYAIYVSDDPYTAAPPFMACGCAGEQAGEQAGGQCAFPPPAPVEAFVGLCVDGTSNGATKCGCSSELTDTTLAECSATCASTPSCTGFSRHPGGSCKIYTDAISARHASAHTPAF